ncbi:hypothetical protein Landi51_06229 [Colletotrichum acutatum]
MDTTLLALHWAYSPAHSFTPTAVDWGWGWGTLNGDGYSKAKDSARARSPGRFKGGWTTEYWAANRMFPRSGTTQFKEQGTWQHQFQEQHQETERCQPGLADHGSSLYLSPVPSVFLSLSGSHLLHFT